MDALVRPGRQRRVTPLPWSARAAIAGSLGIWSIRDVSAVTNTLERASWSTVSTWILSVIPMFVLMGVLLERSGATANIFRGVKALVGWVPGGLAVSTNFGGAAMGAASGSTLGVTYALGRICIPEMVRSGYDKRLATSAVLMPGRARNCSRRASCSSSTPGSPRSPSGSS